MASWIGTGGSNPGDVCTSGKMGIGQTSPSYMLEVYENTDLLRAHYDGGNNYPEIIIGNNPKTTLTNMSVVIGNGNNSPSLCFNSSSEGKIAYDVTNDKMYFYTGGSFRLILDGSGNFGIGVAGPSSKLDVDGYIESTQLTGGSSADLEATTGGVIQRKASDRRLKKNIKNIRCALEKIKKLRGVKFDWKDRKKMGRSDYGLIGQEVERVVPELVTKDKEGYRSVKYTNTVAILIEAIKEQQAQISALEKKLLKIGRIKSK